MLSEMLAITLMKAHCMNENRNMRMVMTRPLGLNTLTVLMFRLSSYSMPSVYVSVKAHSSDARMPMTSMRFAITMMLFSALLPVWGSWGCMLSGFMEFVFAGCVVSITKVMAEKILGFVAVVDAGSL